MSVVPAERDRQPDLVEARGPAQHRTVLDGIEPPRLGHVVEQRDGGLLDPIGLRDVDVIALDEHPDGPVADVLVRVPAQQVVQHSLAQGAGRDGHLLDLQALEDRGEHRDPAHEDRDPLGRQPGERDLVDGVELQERGAQRLESLARDGAVRPTVLPQDPADGVDRPGRPERLVPAGLPERSLDRAEFEERRHHRVLEAALAELAVAEVAERVRHAPHVEAVRRARLEAVAEDDLGAPSADVDHQALAAGGGRGVGDAEVDEPRLFGAAHDLDAVADRRRRLAEESAAVAQAAKGVGPDHPDRVGRHVLEALAEPLEALERAVGDRRLQRAVLAETLGEADPLAEPVEIVELALRVPGHHHVERVRAEVDGCDGVQRAFSASHVATLQSGLVDPRSTKCSACIPTRSACSSRSSRS